MSAIFMQCDHCQGVFITGMVGSTPWPEHVCPDGTRNAPAGGYDVSRLEKPDNDGI